MKRIFFLLLLALPSIVFSKNAQTNPGLEAIKTALGSGDLAKLSQFFGTSVELSFAEDGQAYSKTSAEAALRKFFGENKPKGFSQMHTGTSRGSNDQYCIGNLTTEGTTFRVYIYLKEAGGQTKIQELRFDEE